MENHSSCQNHENHNIKKKKINNRPNTEINQMLELCDKDYKAATIKITLKAIKYLLKQKINKK